MSALGVFDSDEAFWREIRALPTEIKDRPDLSDMLLFKSKVQSLNRNIEDAIRLRLAGWTASLPTGPANGPRLTTPLDIERVFAWQWRRPGPRGGRLFLSTAQAINQLRRETSPEPTNRLTP